MSNITFLFGAGAEQDLGLSGGKNFALNLLGIIQDDGSYLTDRTIKSEKKLMNSRNLAIKEYYSKRIKDATWYPNHVADTWSLDQLVQCAIKKSIVEKSNTRNKTEFQGETKYRYHELFHDNGELDITKCHDIIEKNTSYIGLLDGGFHTLICPTILGRDTFWRILNCYNRAYLLIVGQMLFSGVKDISESDYLKILNAPVKTYEDICRVAENRRNTKHLKNYYDIVREYSNTLQTKNNIKVITANYTPFCEKILGITSENIAYVHGKLGWFEIPDKLEVFDVSNYDKKRIDIEKEIFFPYIFIQSGIKPIVEEKQLREYSKMLSFLDETDVLCILGYRINIDDNHLNAMIRSYIVKKKKIVFFDYDERGKENVLKSLKINDNDSGKYLEYIQLDKTTHLSTFEKELKKLTTTRMNDANIEKEPVGVQ
ncbi:MAG: hypothetical protein R3Y07_00375 [Eubacteriales bacterium]